MFTGLKPRAKFFSKHRLIVNCCLAILALPGYAQQTVPLSEAPQKLDVEINTTTLNTKSINKEELVFSARPDAGPGYIGQYIGAEGDDEGRGVALGADGSVVVVGWTAHPETGRHLAFLTKYNSKGSAEFAHIFSLKDTSEAEANRVAVDANTGVITVVGRDKQQGRDDWDAMALSFSAEGEYLAGQLIASPLDDSFNAVQWHAPSGELFLCGETSTETGVKVSMGLRTVSLAQKFTWALAYNFMGTPNGCAGVSVSDSERVYYGGWYTVGGVSVPFGFDVRGGDGQPDGTGYVFFIPATSASSFLSLQVDSDTSVVYSGQHEGEGLFARVRAGGGGFVYGVAAPVTENSSDVVLASEGRTYYVGTLAPNKRYARDIYVFFFDYEGRIVAAVAIGGEGKTDDFGNSIARSPNGTFYLTGRTYSPDLFPGGLLGPSDAFLLSVLGNP